MGNTKLVVANVYKSESRRGGKFVREGAKLMFSEKLVSRDNAVICNEDDRNPRFYDIDEEATRHYYEVTIPEQAEQRRLESDPHMFLFCFCLFVYVFVFIWNGIFLA